MKIALSRNETLVLRLRDCFTAGYILPQYCIDNGIKKPLYHRYGIPPQFKAGGVKSFVNEELET